MSRFATPLLIAWLATTTLHGAPLAASIAVERDATAGACPDRAALTRGVERILQRRLESNDAPDADLLESACGTRSACVSSSSSAERSKHCGP